MFISTPDYFDLTKHDVDEITLLEDSSKTTCRITSKSQSRIIYKGFKLTDKPQVNICCDVSFYRSSRTAKYIPRLTFIKVDKNRLIKEQGGKEKVRIELSDSDSAENFWKTIGFLFEFKHLVDVDAFEKKYAVLDNDAYVIEFESKEQADKVKALIELFKKANLSDVELETVLRETREINLKQFHRLMTETDSWQHYQAKYRAEIKGQGEEAVWHHFLKKHHWFLGLNVDIRFIRDLISEGNVGIQNSRGRGSPSSDFIGISDYTTLIELKTPRTNIFTDVRSSTARANTWSFSRDFIDGMSQCLGLKFDWDKYGKSKDVILDSAEILDQNKFRTVDPKAIFVIGNKNREFPSESADKDIVLMRDTFQRFRRNSRNIDIVTFDELYERAEFIVHGSEPSTFLDRK